MLTFLAGAELDPVVFRVKWNEATVIGLSSFFAPFLGCAAVASYFLGWSPAASWLTGIALSTTSVAVIYAVMLEFGFNVTDHGKTVLAACFVTDLGTVVALGLMFAPFTMKTIIFALVSVAAFAILPATFTEATRRDTADWPKALSLMADFNRIQWKTEHS